MLSAPGILFMARDDNARTLIAAALLAARSTAHFEIEHGGLVEFAPSVHPLAVMAMAEIGIDLQTVRPCPLSAMLGRRSFAWAIALRMPDEDDAPRLFPGAVKTVQWEIADPCLVGSLAAFCAARDQLDHAIQQWLAEEAQQRNEQLVLAGH